MPLASALVDCNKVFDLVLILGVKATLKKQEVNQMYISISNTFTTMRTASFRFADLESLQLAKGVRQGDINLLELCTACFKRTF